MSSVTKNKLSVDKKLFLVIFAIAFIIFLFTTDAHRYTIDEDMAQQQSLRIATQEPHPLYVEGKSSVLFEYPDIFPVDAPWFTPGPVCQNAILCSKAQIGHSLTQVPFIFINHNFHIFTKDSVVWTTADFDDPHYVYWRNTLNPDFTFLELFYGPVFSALSTAVFFLICRTFNFSQKTSLILTLLYAFTTMAWAYSQTSLNGVPVTFFVLLGFLYFRKFQNNYSAINLMVCGTSLGFAFLVRLDAVLFIVPLFLFLLYEVRKQNERFKKIFSYLIPTASAYVIDKVIFQLVRYGFSLQTADYGTNPIGAIPTATASIFESMFGLLLSPGVGLLIFVPILFTMFFSFPDFYSRNKSECILILSFAVLFLYFYGAGAGGWWHGLVAWGPRYLLPIIPFLLLPLGASIERRKSRIIKTSLVTLGYFGFFFNLVHMVQDVSWFVWGRPGSTQGLFSLGKAQTELYIHDSVIWSFEFSQLTHSIINAFTSLQVDIFLFKVLGAPLFGFTFVIIIVPLTYFLLSLLKNKKYSQKEIY